MRNVTTQSETSESLVQRIHDGDREAIARYVMRIEPLIRRRISGKLGTKMRRVFDSQDIMATVLRRLDLYAQRHHIRATTEGELMSLIMKIANTAVIDKARLLKRLLAAEDDPELARLLYERVQNQGSESEQFDNLLSRVFARIGQERDARMLWLWLSGLELKSIGSILGMTPEAARKRWERLRGSLADLLQEEYAV